MRERGSKKWNRSLFRFASDVIGDLRDSIDAACLAARCAPMLEEAKVRLAAFLRAGRTGFSYEDRGDPGDQARPWYGWRMQGGSTRFDLGCAEAGDAPEVDCELALDLDQGLLLRYSPHNSLPAVEPAIALTCEGDRAPLGEIRFGRTTSGTPVMLLAGLADGARGSTRGALPSAHPCPASEATSQCQRDEDCALVDFDCSACGPCPGTAPSAMTQAQLDAAKRACQQDPPARLDPDARSSKRAFPACSPCPGPRPEQGRTVYRAVCREGMCEAKATASEPEPEDPRVPFLLR
jgi:hypothetical protein